MNSWVGIGRLTKDPEVRYTTGHSPMCVATFNMAIDRPGKDEADFPRIKVFGKQAESCERYLQKGSKVAVQGSLTTGSYDKNGLTIYYTEILANRVEFLGGKIKENDNVQPPEAEVQQEGFQAMASDDIPF